MNLVETHRILTPADLSALTADPQQVYNGLDCGVTFEVWESLQSLFNTPPEIYAFERALQGPALEMMLRGFRIDRLERDRAIGLLTRRVDRLKSNLNRLADAVWSPSPFSGRPANKRDGWSLNPNSLDQCKEFFYGRMKLPEIWTSIKGERALRMNRETLEKLEVYFHAKPIIATILAIRDLEKKIEVLTAEVDPDWRMRTSINVGATETGRFSSSKSTTGTGQNLFNIEDELRRMFVSDTGWKLCGIDLEQAESREVGWICGRLFGDWRYLDACEAGDLHTFVAKMVWPDRGWDGSHDREIAEQLYYRHYSYRYMAKRLGHASNYLMTPWTASRQLKCPIKLCEDFQLRYFTEFAPIPKWQRWVAEQIQTTQQLTTVFGRRRHFFGRPDDEATIREAVAYEPQSSTADRLNIGLYRIWKHFGTRIQILLQLYDAIYFQFREDDNEEEIVQEALQLIDVPLEHKGRRFSVPGEAKVGWNWAPYATEKDVQEGKAREVNLDGLKKRKGQDTRRRTELLDRVM